MREELPKISLVGLMASFGVNRESPRLQRFASAGLSIIVREPDVAAGRSGN